MAKSIVTRKVKESRNRVDNLSTPQEMAIDTIRLVYCQSDVTPDPAFFKEDRVNSSLVFEVVQAKHDGGGTTFFFEATVEIASSQKRKKPAWKMATAFFVAMSHDPTLSLDQVKELIRVTAVPAAMMRFTTFMEAVATMAGIPISSFASKGMSLPHLEFDFIEDESEAAG